MENNLTKYPDKTTLMKEAQQQQQRKQELIKIGYEFLLIALLSTVVTLIFSYWIEPLLGLDDNYPMPVRILVILAIVAFFVSKNKEDSWKLLGLRMPQKKLRFFLVLFGLIFFKLFLFGPILDSIIQLFNLQPADYSSFAFIEGNTPLLISFLVLSWTNGAFAEEMIFRGYLMNRLGKIFGNKQRYTILLVLLIQAVIFGMFHMYQGVTGVVTTTFVGLLMGIAYVLSGRNLWVPIIVHGLVDTASFIIIYNSGIPS